MTALSGWSLGIFLATALLAFTAVGLVRALALRWRVLALPGPRQSHQLPTPTGGGLGIIASLLLVTAWPGAAVTLPGAWLAGVLPGMALLGLIGWRDDQRPVRALWRFSVQVAVSLWLLFLLRSGWPVSGLALLCSALCLPLMLGLMNAWNFMDGSNGMAGCQGLFMALVLVVLFVWAGEYGLALAALMLAAACAGFLPWNVPQARVFMGDAGSVPLGFAFAALLLLGWQQGALSLSCVLLLPSVFLVDAGLTLLRRFLRGEPLRKNRRRPTNRAARDPCRRSRECSRYARPRCSPTSTSVRSRRYRARTAE
jgi:UDP-N-acetylmuramyl pentapeptide phosphotransferase/UDP-N-acetylglucosamine-1-phosphate transferase